MRDDWKSEVRIFNSVLFFILLVLKLTEEIDWSWWWVFAPFWIPIVFITPWVVVLFVLRWFD